MKIIKRILLSISVLIAVGFLFRGWFYRQLVTYKSVGQRAAYSATADKLVDCIEAGVAGKKDPDIQAIIRIGRSITSRQLTFTADQNDTDPNQLIHSRTAHCVGYASFFATTCNYLLKKYNLADTWMATSQVGQLYFFGTNIHQYFNTPFFKDHDFVTIKNKKTGAILAVDPTVSDYLCIDFVAYTPN